MTKRRPCRLCHGAGEVEVGGDTGLVEPCQNKCATKRRPGSRTDAERLDWLRDRMACGEFMAFDRNLGGWVKINPHVPFRAEIDAAIKASQRTRKTGKVGA